MKGGHRFRAEVRLLRHLPGAKALSVLLIALTLLAVASGTMRLGSKLQTVQPLIAQEAELRESLQVALQRYEQAADKSAAAPLGSQPGALGFSVLSAYVVIEPPPLAPLAAGVSALMPDYYRFDAHGMFLQRSTSSIDNPLRLSAGSFDLAFVLVFLIPIIVITLSYDVMSREKELGVLALVGAQGVSIQRFVALKLLVRGLVIVVAIVAVNLLGLLVVSLIGAVPGLLSVVTWIAVAVLYGLIWFGLAALTYFEKAGPSPELVWTLITLGWIALALGELDRAQALAERGARLAAAVGPHAHPGQAPLLLAQVARARHDAVPE